MSRPFPSAGDNAVMQKPVQVYDHPVPVGTLDNDDEIDLLAAARTLWRGKFWIVLCIGLSLIASAYSTFVTAVPLYTATAEMALQPSSLTAPDIQSIVAGFSGDEASINTEMAIITSGTLIGHLVDELQLDRDPEFNGNLEDPEARTDLLAPAKAAVGAAIRSMIRAVLPGSTQEDEPEASAESLAKEERQEVVEAVRGAVSTDSSYDTYAFTISATSRDPDKAALIANTLALLYRDDQIRMKVETTERMANWLSERVGELRADLDARQNEMSDLRARSALVSQESLQALNEQAIELQSELSAVQGQLTRADEKLAALQATAQSGDIEAKLEAAEDGQLEAAAAALATSDPTAQVRFDRRFSQIILQVEAERDRAQERQSELQRSVDELSAQFEGQSADLLRLQQFEQEAAASQALYETFLTRLKEATAQQSAYEADSRILTEAPAGAQIAPRPARSLALALLLGLIAGAGLVLGREFLQNGFRTAEALESRTGRTVLGQIPRIPARARPDTIQYLLDKPTSAAAEAVRNLRTSLLLSNVDRPPRVIMASSSVPNEGKTTLAIALAQNLAGLEKKVLLIEGDIRRRTFNAYFPNDTEKGGLLSVVSGKQALESAVVRPEGLGIDVLMGERSSVNAADVFSSESFQRFLEHARSVYDYVIIDTPPVLVVPDARVIAQHVDALIYVVLWDSTSSTQVEEGLRQFRSVNAPVAGLVLSRIDPKGMKRYGYGGRYGPYSRYGRNYYEA